MRVLQDSYDRRFQYLRLSLTEVCNFRCSYCLPDGYQSTCTERPLNESEIICLVRAFAELGISKVRLTGGEPTTRQDVVSIVKQISQIEGIEKVGLTTNGYRLAELATSFKESGLTNLNVSIDSLEEAGFYKITGKPLLQNVLHGVKSALAAGIGSVKINTVLLKDLNDFELPSFVELVRQLPVSVRFIELMQTGSRGDYFSKHHLSTTAIESYLRDRDWSEAPQCVTDGPAKEFCHGHYLGRVGVIAPYSKNFCDSCNRLRVSNRGGLQLCLFGQGQVNLRPWLQKSSQRQELKNKIAESLFLKPASHRLQAGLTGRTENLSSIGG